MQIPALLGRVAAVATWAAVLANPAIAYAEGYPDRPIQVVIPAPPGGGADSIMRTIAPQLGARLGKPVVFDYRPGASGNIAAKYVADAEPDGYTLLLAYHAYTVNPSLFPNLDFDYATDFAPITRIASSPMGVTVNNAVPVHSLKELIALAKEEPGKLNYGSAGNGSGGHIVGAMFNEKFGLNISHVPYQGSAPMQQDLLGGFVQVTFDASAPVMNLVKAGKLNMLAIMSDERSPIVPDVPTMQEQGFPTIDFMGWYGLFAPKNTPPAVMDRLYREITGIVQNDPQARKLLQNGGYIPDVSESPQEFAGFVKSQIAKVGDMADGLGLKPD